MAPMTRGRIGGGRGGRRRRAAGASGGRRQRSKRGASRSLLRCWGGHGDGGGIPATRTVNVRGLVRATHGDCCIRRSSFHHGALVALARSSGLKPGPGCCCRVACQKAVRLPCEYTAAIAGCIQPGHVTEIIPAKLLPSRCGC
jgi:hypothetical protein